MKRYSCITETRIKDQPAINIDITGYKFFFVKSFNNAGGVGVYINDTLNCRVLNRFHVDLPSCENIWLNVITKDSKSYIVGVLYRHPFSTDVANFIDQLNQTPQVFISKLVLRYQRSFREESCSVTLSNPSHSQDIAHLAELLIF